MMSNSSGNGDILIPSLGHSDGYCSNQPLVEIPLGLPRLRPPPRSRGLPPLMFLSLIDLKLAESPQWTTPLELDTPIPFPSLDQLASARCGWPMPPGANRRAASRPAFSSLHFKLMTGPFQGCELRMHLWEPLIAMALGVPRVTAAWTVLPEQKGAEVDGTAGG